MEKLRLRLKEIINSERLVIWRPYLIFFLVAFLLFGQTLFFKQTNFDDNILVDKQEIFSNLKNIPTIFVSDAFFSVNKVYYRPILNLSYLLDASFSNSSLFVYHLGNILIHILAVCLIFFFLKKITKQPILSFVFSLFFLIHPALVQAVAWLPGRNDSLLTIFVLAAVLFFIRFTQEKHLPSFIAYFVFLLLALLTKEVAIFLPLILVAYTLTIGRRDKLEKTDKLFLILGSGLALFIWFIMRALALEGGAPADLSLIINNLPQAFIMAFKMSAQAILPLSLAVISGQNVSYIPSLIIIPVFALALIRSKQRRNGHVLFGLFWFLLFFFIPFLLSDASAYLNHRLYLPLIGVLIMLGEIDWLKNLDWQKKSVKAVTAILFTLTFLFSFQYSANFKDALSFWQSAVNRSPESALAHNNLGSVYSEQNNLEAAGREYSKALEINPVQRMAHYNLGIIYLKQNNLIGAQKELEREVSINPSFYQAWLALGDVYQQEGKSVEAEQSWQNAKILNDENY